MSPDEAVAAMQSPGKPVCLIIAGPNGAGKTTFAREYLPREARILNFLNADLIAAGLSPLRPEAGALAAGRLFLCTLDRAAERRQDFAFESTLSGLSYVERLKRWRESGYRIELVYLQLSSAAVALKRIASRVRQGGHVVPMADVLRRFPRSQRNFREVYAPLCDAWWVYDADCRPPVLLSRSP
jgi:predicted ABC-type ATPase